MVEINYHRLEEEIRKNLSCGQFGGTTKFDPELDRSNRWISVTHLLFIYFCEQFIVREITLMKQFFVVFQKNSGESLTFTFFRSLELQCICLILLAFRNSQVKIKIDYLLNLLNCFFILHMLCLKLKLQTLQMGDEPI